MIYSSRFRAAALALLVAAGVVPFAPTAQAAATITVTVTNDELNADGDCSLREAIKSANTNALVDACVQGTVGVDTVVLSANTYSVGIYPAGDDAGERGDLDITESLNITGAGATQTTVQWVTANPSDPSQFDRLFDVTSAAAVVSMTGLKITGGEVGGDGGGIRSSGSLTLDSVLLEDHRAGNNGGGIYNTGTLSIIDSTINSNTTQLNGTAIYSDSATGVTITDSVITDNSGNIGAIFNDAGTATVTGTTIKSNTMIRGVVGNGADGTMNVTNTTVSSNSGLVHSGFWNLGALTLTNATVAENTYGKHGTAEVGTGGLFNIGESSTAALKNAILDNGAHPENPSPPQECSGPGISATGPNIIEEMTGCTVSGEPPTTGDAQLRPLGDWGGPTPTHALTPGSPALDAGMSTGAPSTDQRGFPRPVDGPDVDSVAAHDIGAFEALTVNIDNATVTEGTGGTTPAVFTLSLSGVAPEDVVFHIETVFDTGAGNASASDIDSCSPEADCEGTFTIPAGSTSATFTVNVNADSLDEQTEIYHVDLGAPPNSDNFLFGDDTGKGTIVDDDEPPSHARTISLKLRRHLKAKGRVTVDDEFNKCRRTVPVDLQRKKSGTWKTIKTDTTNRDGFYKTKLRDRRGKYRAVASPQSVQGGAHECASATSSVKSHSH